MIELYKNIKKRRLMLKMTQAQLAELSGYADKTMISKIESGVVDLTQSKIQALADALKTTPKDLMGWNDTPNSADAVRIPIFGEVAAGVPLEMITDIIDWEEIPAAMAKAGEYFALKIHGHSMEPKISDGDIVIVRHQNDAETGEIVIAAVNGDAATCKRLKKYRDGIELIPLNPSYEPMFFGKDEIEEKPVTILGKVVELRSKF